MKKHESSFSLPRHRKLFSENPAWVLRSASAPKVLRNYFRFAVSDYLRRAILPVSLLALGLALTPGATGAPGDLDPAFNGTGKTRIGFGLGNDFGRAAAVQADGKLIVAGHAGGDQFVGSFVALVRYNIDSSLDTSFGAGGKVLTAVGSDMTAHVSAMRVQADGKIVVSGYVLNALHYDFLVLRYNPDGTLDPTFGGDGIVTTDLGGDDLVNAMVIDANGKIIVTGSSSVPSNATAIVRYNGDGSLDASFDGDGIVVTQNSTYGYAVTLQSDGKIVVAGGSSSFVVARYNTNGSLDTSFGGGQVTTLINTGSFESAKAVVIETDPKNMDPDKILVAGTSLVGSSGLNLQFTLVRYNLNGTLDTSFDGDGIVNTDIGPKTDFATSLLIQNVGFTSRIFVAGYTADAVSGVYHFAVVRYNESGSLNTSFDGDGIAITPIGTVEDEAYTMRIQAGKLVVVGSSVTSDLNADFAMVRYNPADGSLDSTFDGDGIKTEDLADRGAVAKAIAIQADGKMVVAGYAEHGQSLRIFAVARFDSNGALDPSFGGGDGKVTGGLQSQAEANAVAIQPADGKIVVAGVADGHFRVARYNPDGSPDATFDGDGLVSTVIGTGSYAVAIAIQADGKIVVGGNSYSGTDADAQDFAVARYLTNGALDLSFGNNGVAVTGVGLNRDTATALQIQPDGKILVAGYLITGTSSDIALVRYDSNGVLDPNFGSFGRVATDISGNPDEAFGMAIQADGKIVVTGVTAVGSTAQCFVVRYLNNGALDPTFDGDGKVTTPVGLTVDIAYAVAIEPSGKIVIAGSSQQGSDTEYAVVRYLSNGSLDSSYGIGGKVIIDLSSGSDSAYAMAVDASGRAVLAGDSNSLFGVARLLGDPPPGLAGNVSTRLPVGTGDNALIEGFIVQGPAGSTKKIIVRAIGPSLAAFGVPDALGNPTLEIHDANNATVAANDDWKTTQVGGLISGDQMAQIAASGVAPSNDLESAIIADLAPGSYTAVVRGVGNTTGTGVVDAYDLSATSPARLANIATRGLIQPGDKLMIAGFIIQDAPVRAVVRAIGPSLAPFGITNALPDTTLQLRDSNGAIVRENDDWQTDQKQELESTGLQPGNDLEAALVATIPPGPYTAQVRGKPEQTGIGVVQVYFLQ